jgi:Winged helix DNA-binding domain
VRGTAHLIPAADRGWLHALCAARFRRQFEGSISRRASLADANALLPDAVDILAAGPVDRAALLAELAARGNPDLGLAFNVLVPWIATQGLALGVPDGRYRAADPPPAVDEDEALATMARRYLAGYGPASAADLAAWSGLPLRDARTGLGALAAAGEVENVRIGGAPAYRLPGEPSPEDRTVRLVPAFDEYLLGYRGRALALDAAYARRIQAGGGIVHPAVLLGGRIIGTWRQRRADGRLIVAVEPFRRLPRGTRAALAAEAADVGRFLGVPARLEVGNSPVPVDA